MAMHEDDLIKKARMWYAEAEKDEAAGRLYAARRCRQIAKNAEDQYRRDALPPDECTMDHEPADGAPSGSLLWGLLHDGLAHPLMAITGYSRMSLRFHTWTSRKAWPCLPNSVINSQLPNPAINSQPEGRE